MKKFEVRFEADNFREAQIVAGQAGIIPSSIKTRKGGGVLCYGVLEVDATDYDALEAELSEVQGN